MKGQKVLFSSASDQWSTPAHVYNALDEEFNFNFDPCPLNAAPTFNGLIVAWGTKTFVNPPYSNIAVWCEKAFTEAAQGKTVVMLIPSRTDTKYWHEYIMKADEIRFLRGRLKFGNAKNSAPFPSCVVIFRGRK